MAILKSIICGVSFGLLTLGAAIVTTPIDDFNDAQAQHFGPPCSASVNVNQSGVGRVLCPGITTASMTVTGGSLVAAGLNPSGSVIYTLTAQQAGTYLGVEIDILRGPTVFSSINVVVDGVPVQSFGVPPGNTGLWSYVFPLPVSMSAGTTLQIGFSSFSGAVNMEISSVALYGEAVPEPATWGLVAASLVALVAFRTKAG